MGLRSVREQNPHQRRRADREVGHVGVRNDPVARLELDGRSPVADERAVVDDGRRGAAVVADADSVAVVEEERGARDLGALVARVADGAVVERARLVHRHVDAVAQVVAERRTVEDAPAALVRDVHAVVAVVLDRARVHQDVACVHVAVYTIIDFINEMLFHNSQIPLR